MKKQYILNVKDLSFDFGDFPNGTCIDYQYNGFYLEVKNKVINIEPFGECTDVMQDVKTLSDLKQFITENKEFINIEVYSELLEFIKENEKDGRTNLLPV